MSTVRDLLLFMTSYPDRTPGWAITASGCLAATLGARLSTALYQTRFRQVSNALADKLIQANQLVASENARSRDAAHSLLTEFASKVDEPVRGEQILLNTGSVMDPRELSRQARLHDLTIVPIELNQQHQDVAEELIFQSGRPVILLAPSGENGPRLETICVGWDGSRSATRALADAIPLCKTARAVQVLIVTGDKDLDVDRSGIVRHLALHQVEADVIEVPASEHDAGVALMKHSVEAGADLLVMGAYGHSRTREFVLGGATRSVIGQPLLPVLFAH